MYSSRKGQGSDYSLQNTIAVLPGCTGRREIKTNEMEKRKKLVDYINSMGVDEKIALHNTYCNAANCMDDCIYTMDDMEEILDGVDKWELVRMVQFGDFDCTKEFWGFNGYGNLDSYSAWELPIYPEDIADYILSKEDSLGNDEIKEILDEEDKDNE